MIAQSTRWMLFLWLAVLFVAGGYYACSDDDVDPPKKDGAIDSAIDGAGDDFQMDGFIDAVSSDGPGPTINGSIKSLLGSNPVDGVSVCVKEDSSIPCVTTDSAGAFTISGLDLSNDFTLAGTKTAYMNAEFPVGANQTSLDYHQTMMDDTTVATLMTMLGTTVQSGMGHILFSAKSGASGGASGVTIQLDQSVGEGPFYSNGMGIPDKTLTATSTNGGAAIVNITPGTYYLTFSSTATCTVFHGWKGTTSTDTKITVSADTATTVMVECQ